ncbi:hypothetical protein MLD38_027634 [Melastoma candidum]|uniref:Uncharacterized protein n=1 Tax=Melastoma candidum TaxID=119954 RepID=A0ACB9P439_9MYRT|nr:hypothetical protein MLD38_027634 [Melastoma candidum]
MAVSNMPGCSPIPIHRSGRPKSLICSHNAHVDHQPGSNNPLAKTLSNLLHLRIDKPQSKIIGNSLFQQNSHLESQRISAPSSSPKEVVSHMWRELHGSSDWDGMLDPLHPSLRREIIKYGEFAQATYDGFDFETSSKYRGSCRYNKKKLFDVLGLTKNGYQVLDYVYAMSHAEIPSWLERSRFLDAWSKDSNWMGYVAVSDDKETLRIGRRDIIVAWRGTMTPAECFKDFQRRLEPIGCNSEAKVEHGFLSIYKSRRESTRYNKSSASEQVMTMINKVVEFYRNRGEQVSLTITGHSLGGALALLNAHEVASTIPNLSVSVVSFGAPRVGNAAFKEEIETLGVKALRIVMKQDLVPKMPGVVLNEGLQKIEEITGTLDWVFTHVGTMLELNVTSSPHLKHRFSVMGYHNLETYLHLVDGYLSASSGFRADAKRDMALVNKSCDMLVDELRIPKNWYQLANKGLICNEHGRWVQPERDPEDIPSPLSAVQQQQHQYQQYQLIIENEGAYLGLGSLYGLSDLG